MGTFYIDPVLGSDANDGSAWGASYAWKTIKTGATAARIAPGDVIKIAKSPDPTSVGNATWNLNSKTVTLATARNALIEACDTSWAASANVTASVAATTRKEGSNEVTLTIAASFTTGLIGYKTLSAQLDLSAYQQVSFWFRDSLGSAASVFKLCLCSDASGAVIVDEFTIPAIEAASKAVFIPFTLDKGSALGSTINSVALYALSDPGIPVLMIDNIIAVKAVGSADSLSLTSLISKNSLATGGTEPWYPIQSINGTTVLLDCASASIATAGRGANTATETVTTYKRECHRTVSTTDCTIQDSGVAGSIIDFQGGYNPSTGDQDGETFWDGLSTIGNGIDFSSKNYVRTNRMNMVRALFGVYFSASTYCEAIGNTLCGCSIGLYCTGGTQCIGTFLGSVNNSSHGLNVLGTSYANLFTISHLSNNLGSGLALAASYAGNKFVLGKVNNNAADGLNFAALSYDAIISASEIRYNGAYGANFVTLSKGITIIGATISDNTTAGIYYPTLGNNNLRGCTLSDTTKVTGHVAFGGSRLASDKQDGSSVNNYLYTDGGYIKSQNSVRHTAADIAWALYPTSANRSAYYPLVMSLARLAVNANAQVTFTAWLYRSNAGLSAYLRCRGLQISGVDTDVLSSDMTVDGSWEQKSIVFTPTEIGVVEIEVIAYGGTAYYAVVDDIDYLQA